MHRPWEKSKKGVRPLIKRLNMAIRTDPFFDWLILEVKTREKEDGHQFIGPVQIMRSVKGGRA